MNAISSTYRQWGLRARANISSKTNQSWVSLVTHSSINSFVESYIHLYTKIEREIFYI